jgi:hypothetical protein
MNSSDHINDSHVSSIVVILDLSDTFDTIDHNIFVDRLGRNLSRCPPVVQVISMW